MFPRLLVPAAIFPGQNTDFDEKMIRVKPDELSIYTLPRYFEFFLYEKWMKFRRFWLGSGAPSFRNHFRRELLLPLS